MRLCSSFICMVLPATALALAAPGSASMGSTHRAHPHVVRVARLAGHSRAVGSVRLSATQAAAKAGIPFKDVPKSHWAYGAIHDLLDKQILVSDSSKFDGEKPVTRYEMAVALYRMVHYLEPDKTPASPPQGADEPVVWLMHEGYLASDSPLLSPPFTRTVSPSLFADSLAYVSDRVLQHRAKPNEERGNYGDDPLDVQNGDDEN